MRNKILPFVQCLRSQATLRDLQIFFAKDFKLTSKNSFLFEGLSSQELLKLDCEIPIAFRLARYSQHLQWVRWHRCSSRGFSSLGSTGRFVEYHSFNANIYVEFRADGNCFDDMNDRLTEAGKCQSEIKIVSFGRFLSQLDNFLSRYDDFNLTFYPVQRILYIVQTTVVLPWGLFSRHGNFFLVMTRYNLSWRENVYLVCQVKHLPWRYKTPSGPEEKSSSG